MDTMTTDRKVPMEYEKGMELLRSGYTLAFQSESVESCSYRLHLPRQEVSRKVAHLILASKMSDWLHRILGLPCVFPFR